MRSFSALGFSARARLLGSLTLGSVGSVTIGAAAVNAVIADTAHASGPVERMVQVLIDPTDPNVVVVRYGVASEGFLFSRDGGRSFKAMCSQLVAPQLDESDKVKRVSSAVVPSTAATLLDSDGKLLFSQISGLWSDNGQGCGWSQLLPGAWANSLKHDPKNSAELLAVVNTPAGSEEVPEELAQLMRRTADGTFSTVGSLVPHVVGQRAYGSDLITATTPSGTQLYAAVTVLAPGAVTDTQVLVGSSDGGKTWSPGITLPNEQNFVLLAIDPSEPKRILASIYRDNSPDTLVLSQDGGKTFADYQEIQETSAVTFAPDGRIYIADAGDSSGAAAVGGLWTAAKLGDPLTKVAGTQLLDCAAFDPATQKLFVCQRDKFGRLDPSSGAFEKLAEINAIESLIECPGVDVPAACSTQLNAGASWCCAGHYPFTPFCGQYDVTMKDSQRLYCGLSGRAYDQQAGRGPNDGGAAVDAGASKPDAGLKPDAATPVAMSDAGETPRKQSDDGCSLSPSSTRSSTATLSASLSVLLVALARFRRRARR